MLQLTVVDFAEFSPSLQFSLSVLLMIGLTCLIVFVISRFICNGPWVPGFYSKSTSAKSLLEIRQRNPDFDADGYLKEHPVTRVKPWGSFFINFDLERLFFWRPNSKKIEPLDKTFSE